MAIVGVTSKKLRGGRFAPPDLTADSDRLQPKRRNDRAVCLRVVPFCGFTNPLYLMELAEHFISFEAKGVSVGPNP